jgi:hypothetical protein
MSSDNVNRTAEWQSQVSDAERRLEAQAQIEKDPQKLTAQLVSPNLYVAAEALANENTPLSALDSEFNRLVEAEQNGTPIPFDKLNRFATNSNLTPALITTLATRPEKEIRSAIAKKSDLPSNILDTLITDTEPNVRASCAMRADLSPEQQVILAQDETTYVRCNLAKNPGNLDPKTLDILIATAVITPHNIVKWLLARNDLSAKPREELESKSINTNV